MRNLTTTLERLRRRTRGADSAGDAGFTLAELLVVVLVLGILTTAVSAMMITGMRTSTAASLRLDETNSARTSMDAMTRVLRTAVLPSQLQATCAGCDAATAFLSGTPTSMTFYANIDNPDNAIGPSKVSFTVGADGKLIMTAWKPDAHDPDDFNYKWTDCVPGTSGCGKTVRMLAEGVPSTTHLFTYYDNSGAEIPTPIAGVELGKVASVDVLLTVQKASNQNPLPVTFINRVALPNADSIVKADDGT